MLDPKTSSVLDVFLDEFVAEVQAYPVLAVLSFFTVGFTFGFAVAKR